MLGACMAQTESNVVHRIRGRGEIRDDGWEQSLLNDGMTSSYVISLT